MVYIFYINHIMTIITNKNDLCVNETYEVQGDDNNWYNLGKLLEKETFRFENTINPINVKILNVWRVYKNKNTMINSGIYNNMDKRNQKAMDVWAEKGLDSAIKHMFTDDETGRPLTYGEMRARYG